MGIDLLAIEAAQALGLGLSLAGLLASGFELVTDRRASFALLQAGGLRALASVPVVVLSAPFIILRNTIRGRRLEERPMRFVMAAAVIACLWSLMSGRVLMDVARLVAGA